jgi:DNA-binding NtrC family response regulator
MVVKPDRTAMSWVEKEVLLKTEDTGAGEHLEAGNLIGHSPRMLRLGRLIARIAPRRNPVLLIGESGVGKETVARAIHAQGTYPQRTFVPVDCAAATPALFEPDMLGPAAMGVFPKLKERSSGTPGTIFLSEVWGLSPELQARLMRVMQEREIRPAGDVRAREARIIASSSRDLELAVQQGTFRRDLYLRLNLSSLRVPPLRERKEDIGLLADHFLAWMTAGKGLRRSLSSEAKSILMNYDWPGNVHELKETLEQAVAMASGPVLEVGDLPLHLQRADSIPGMRRTIPLGSNIVPLAEVERQTILNALERLNGNKLMTARALGIGKTTLYRKLKEYGICAPVMGRPLGQR